MDDAAWLDAHRDGDADAFAAIVRRHAGWLTAVARRRVRDPALADDVVQAVFIVLARDATARVPVGRPLVGWLYRAAELSARHALRGESRRRKHEREAGMQHVRRSIGEDASPDDAIAPIERAMRSLRPAFREAILLHFYEQRSTADAAAMLAISPEAFRKRIARAIEALRARVDDRGLIAPAVAIEATLRLPGVATPGAAGSSVAGPSVAGPGVRSLASRVRRSIAARRLAPPIAATFGIAATLAAIAMIGPRGAPRRDAARPRVAIATTTTTTTSTRPADVATLANEQLYLIRTATLTSTSRQWAAAALALIDLGPPAVPAIVAELDRSDRDLEQRVLPIVLRAIGDRRAVPALIRALPRTAVNTSDFGLPLPRDVATRLLPHLIETTSDARFDTARSLSVSVGRSVRETFASLESMTGRRVASDDDEEWYREPEGTDWTASRVRAYRGELAARWRAAADDVATTRPIDALPVAAADVDAVELAGVARFGPLFPNHARLGSVRWGTIEVQNPADRKAFFDFESGRAFEVDEGIDVLRDSTAANDFDGWSERLGIDMMMTQLIDMKEAVPPATRPGPNGEHARREAMPDTFSMRVWPASADRWDAFADEVAGDAPIDPGRGPSGSFNSPPLATGETPKFDDGSRTFLFITADETRGIVRFGPQDDAAARRSFEYRLIDRGEARAADALSDGIAGPAIDPARPWATTRPVAFGPTRRVTLAAAGSGRPGALDLDTDRTAIVDASLAGADALGTRLAWARANHLDVLPASFVKAALGGVQILDVAASELDDAEWDGASATTTLERAHRVVPQREFAQTFVMRYPSPDDASTRTRCIRTPAGAIVLLRLVDVDEKAETTTVEYKRVEAQP